MRKIVLTLNPNEVISVHEKEYRDLKSMGLVSREVTDQPTPKETKTRVEPQVTAPKYTEPAVTTDEETPDQPTPKRYTRKKTTAQES